MNAPIAVGQLDRSTYLGGSDVAPILGISPWRTPLDVYLDKIQPRKEETDPGRLKVLNRGKRMEPYVIDLLAEETGLEIIRRGERYLDPDLDFIAAEIDAEAATGENIEIKTVSPFKAREWGEEQSDEIPLHYAAQAMHGMMVTSREVCVFGVLIGGDDFRVYRIERDDVTIDAIRQKEIEFWSRIQARQAPEPSTVSDVFRLFGTKDSGLAVETSESLQADVIALKSLKDDAKRLGAQIDLREERIKLHMADASILTMNGKPVLTWKEQASKRFDQSAFKADQPELYEKFIKTVTSRVFRLK
jgi:putative phage-type endonuclease